MSLLMMNSTGGKSSFPLELMGEKSQMTIYEYPSEYWKGTPTSGILGTLISDRSSYGAPVGVELFDDSVSTDGFGSRILSAANFSPYWNGEATFAISDTQILFIYHFSYSSYHVELYNISDFSLVSSEIVDTNYDIVPASASYDKYTNKFSAKLNERVIVIDSTGSIILNVQETVYDKYLGYVNNRVVLGKKITGSIFLKFISDSGDPDILHEITSTVLSNFNMSIIEGQFDKPWDHHNFVITDDNFVISHPNADYYNGSLVYGTGCVIQFRKSDFMNTHIHVHPGLNNFRQNGRLGAGMTYLGGEEVLATSNAVSTGILYKINCDNYSISTEKSPLGAGTVEYRYHDIVKSGNNIFTIAPGETSIQIRSNTYAVTKTFAWTNRPATPSSYDKDQNIGNSLLYFKRGRVNFAMANFNSAFLRDSLGTNAVIEGLYLGAPTLSEPMEVQEVIPSQDFKSGSLYGKSFDIQGEPSPENSKFKYVVGAPGINKVYLDRDQSLTSNTTEVITGVNGFGDYVKFSSDGYHVYISDYNGVIHKYDFSVTPATLVRSSYSSSRRVTHITETINNVIYYSTGDPEHIRGGHSWTQDI